MLDKDGYRPNVGIILLNHHNMVLIARRKGATAAWQFPQGGIDDQETAEQSMFRELDEEIGLSSQDVKILAYTPNWLYYDVPQQLLRNHSHSHYRGQKQIWFLLQFLSADNKINVQKYRSQEFDAWKWVKYWDPVEIVISFKQQVYREALEYLERYQLNISDNIADTIQPIVGG